jgi:hypothetical protein
MKYRSVWLARHDKCAWVFDHNATARDFHDSVFAGRYSREGEMDSTKYMLSTFFYSDDLISAPVRVSASKY